MERVFSLSKSWRSKRPAAKSFKCAFIMHHRPLPIFLVGNASYPLIVPTLYFPDANHLQHLSPESNRWVDKGLLIRINSWSLPNKIGLVFPNDLWSLVNLPKDVEDRVQANNGVVREERRRIKRWSECSIAVKDKHRDVPRKANPGAVRLKASVIGLEFWVRGYGQEGAADSANLPESSGPNLVLGKPNKT